MPAAFYQFKSTKHNWAFKGEPEQLNGRQLQHDRGKTWWLIINKWNGLYKRKHLIMGLETNGMRWMGYADVLPYFKKWNVSGGGDDLRGQVH